jgi:hypothetical protein
MRGEHVKKITLAAIAVAAFAFVGTAGAALVPGTFDQNNTGCPVAKAQNGWLHLEKNCVSSTPASAYGLITGMNGQPFTSGSFTLKSASQCQGGSPRFNIVTTVKTYFLGCNNVTPVVNADGTATYTFTPASILAAHLEVPTGTITQASVIIDIQGVADVKDVVLNGVAQQLASGGKHHGHDDGDEHGHHGDHGHGHGHHDNGQRGNDSDNDND